MLYGRITGLVFSLFLPAFYRHVARNWGGIGILYLILLLTLAWIPSLVNFHLWLRKIAEEDFPKVAKDWPDISIKNGKVTSPVPQPLEIKDENGIVFFVLDTTGKINNLDQTKAMFLLTETKFFQRDQLNNIQIHDLTTFPDFDVTKERLQEWVDTGATWAAVCVYPFCLFGSMIRAIILMLLASIAGLIFNAAFNAKVTYGGLLRFAAVGMTLSVYIDTGVDIAHLCGQTNINLPPFPLWFLIALALTSAYVGFGCFVSVPKLVDIDYDRESDDDWRRPRHADAKDDGYRDDGGFKAGEP
jgi:hypothetical protein